MLLALLATGSANSDAKAGEAHRTLPLSSASARRGDGKSEVEVTVWYPATANSHEIMRTVGPPATPLFEIATMAADATPLPGRHPVILMSHGFGGTAADMGWLAAPLARAGYLVIAVDHPGNNALDKTAVGATAWWERPRDLIAALCGLAADPLLGGLVDTDHVAALGYSMGGATVLALAGARIDPAHLDRFCATHQSDGVCQPPAEMPGMKVDMAKGIAMLGLQDAAAHAGDATALPTIRAVMAIAPNSQTLTDESLRRIRVPVLLVVGDRDVVVPIANQAGNAARLIPGAQLKVVPGASHYSFIAACTKHGRESIDVCRLGPEKELAHTTAVNSALEFFGRRLPAPRGGKGQ